VSTRRRRNPFDETGPEARGTPLGSCPKICPGLVRHRCHSDLRNPSVGGPPGSLDQACTPASSTSDWHSTTILEPDPDRRDGEVLCPAVIQSAQSHRQRTGRRLGRLDSVTDDGIREGVPFASSREYFGGRPPRFELPGLHAWLRKFPAAGGEGAGLEIPYGENHLSYGVSPAGLGHPNRQAGRWAPPTGRKTRSRHHRARAHRVIGG